MRIVAIFLFCMSVAMFAAPFGVEEELMTPESAIVLWLFSIALMACAAICWRVFEEKRKEEMEAMIRRVIRERDHDD